MPIIKGYIPVPRAAPVKDGYGDYSFNECMRVRRKIINECKGNPTMQKALAVALFIKHKFGRQSSMPKWSINKLHKLTRISPTTLKKYLPIIEKQGWLRYDGKNIKRQTITIVNLCSNTENRNIKVDKFCFDSFNDVYRSLRAFIVLILQSHKDFVKRAIQIATEPRNGQDFKGARKLVKRLVKQGVLKSVYEKYKEFGLSYNRIAKETGNCARTAQRIIQYAIKKNWVQKHHNQEQVFAPKIFYRQIEGFFFATKNNLYRIFANTYTINQSVEKDLAWQYIS